MSTAKQRIIVLSCLAVLLIAAPILNYKFNKSTETNVTRSPGPTASSVATGSGTVTTGNFFADYVNERESQRTDEAVAAFRSLTEDFPELPEPYNNLAVIYAERGQYGQARDALETAVRNNPRYATAQENLGDVYIQLAREAYSRAQRNTPGGAPAAAQLGRKLSLVRELLLPRKSGS